MADRDSTATSGNGRGRFKPSEAEAFVRFSQDELGKMVFPRLFREFAKQTMWELHLLFEGQLVDSEGKDHYLDLSLTKDQLEEAREAFSTLWAIIKHPNLRRSPFGVARADTSFHRFMSRAAGDDPRPPA